MRDEFKNNNWSKRYLPHYNADAKFQMITYRLADSLPQTIQEKIAYHSPGSPQDFAGRQVSEIQRRKSTEESLDKGYGSCLLAIDEVAQAQINNWKYFDGVKYDLIAYVVMPNHVHVLIKTKADYSLAKIVWGWKTYVSKFVNGRPDIYEKFIKSFDNKKSITFNTAPLERLRHHKPAKSCGEPRKCKQSIWNREYWDRFIRDENHFKSAIEYIHNNPIKAGLVKSCKDWKWSSVHNLL